MKTTEQKNTLQKLVSAVHLARIHLAKAEGQLAVAKETARVARRRRKEAKQASRRTKQQARLAKRELAGAKLTLAEAEARLTWHHQHADEIKSGKKSTKKTAVTPRLNQPVPPPASTSPKGAATRKSARMPRARSISVRRKTRIAPSPVAVARDADFPVQAATASRDHTTRQIVAGLGSTFDVEVAAEAPVGQVAVDKQSG